MRDIALVLAMLGYVPFMLRNAAAGLLIWAWLSMAAPHQEVYGFARGQQFNLVVALITVAVWIASREPKRLPPGLTPKLMLLFVAWFTLNSFMAPYPDWSWPLWQRFVKIFVFAFLCMLMANTKARLHALIWVAVISVGYYGVKGGVFTIRGGGHAIVFGPPNTVIADNNQLAAAVVMTIPLMNYLRLHTANKLLRTGLLVANSLMAIEVLGSNSRGGFAALALTGFLFWLRSRRRVLYTVMLVVAVTVALQLLPQSFFDRLNTIQNAGADSSFMGRVNAWMVAFGYAVDHFPFGGGFSAMQLRPIWSHYSSSLDNHAAHSIFFEVLGDTGFGGLAMYVGLLVLGLRNAQAVVRRAQHRPELRWAEDLGRMIFISLCAFAVGGGLLSMAYWDEYLMLLAILPQLSALTRAATQTVQRDVVPSATSGSDWHGIRPVSARG